jgi:hypothetical protein
MPTVFTAPEWMSNESQYKLAVTEDYAKSLAANTSVNLKRDSAGSYTFSNQDQLLEVTSALLHSLLKEGSENNWFSKLPSHEQLLKRVKHTFLSLPEPNQTLAYVSCVYMNPKVLTLQWTPVSPPLLPAAQVQQQGIYFEDSDSEDADITESNLPPVELRNDRAATQEEYLLTRLRAAKARVEAEQIRMQYFEATGSTPPESDEDEDEDEDGNGSE